jgi:hypothetical protein
MVHRTPGAKRRTTAGTRARNIDVKFSALATAP